MPLSPIQIAQSTYAITELDIAQGFASVQMTWPEPFTNTEYAIVWGVEDIEAFVSPAVDFAVGDVHNKTTAGFTAVVELPAAIPQVQGQEAQVDLIASEATTAPTTVVAPITTLYQVTLYYGASGTSGNNSDAWAPTITWTDPSGSVLQATPYGGAGPYAVLGSTYGGVPPAGGPNSLQSYSIPFFALAGTPITVTGAYTGTPFPINYSARVTQMPTQASVPPVGQPFQVTAVGIHN